MPGNLAVAPDAGGPRPGREAAVPFGRPMHNLGHNLGQTLGQNLGQNLGLLWIAAPLLGPVARADTSSAAEAAVFVEEAKLVAGGVASGDFFGQAVALDGDTAVVGARFDDGQGSDSGAAYVFVRGAVGWTLQQRLVAADTATEDLFGHSVAISGDTILVGAPFHSEVGTFSGAAYVFVRSGTSWTEEQKLVADDAAPQDWFGHAVALDGDTALVGANLDDEVGEQSGSAYVFVRTGTAWTQQQKLVGSDTVSLDFFGSAVALRGDTAVVGAELADPVGKEAGSAYVFARTGTTWTEAQELVPSGASSADAFGASVAVCDGAILVGAPGADGVASGSGVAYAFAWSGTAWIEEQVLVAEDGAADDQFGASVALDGGTALIGAPHDDAVDVLAGSAYAFVRGATWSLGRKIHASDGSADDAFGASLALDGACAVVGAHLDDDLGRNAGAAYAFVLRDVPASFCDDSDGSLAYCPCGNTGGPDSGCDISQGTGGVSAAVVEQDVVARRATIAGSGYPTTTTPMALLIRGNDREPLPVVFGDGLRCVGLNGFARLEVTLASGGTSVHEFTHSAGPGVFYYQIWFRNSPATFCDPLTPYNLSNGRALAW